MHSRVRTQQIYQIYIDLIHNLAGTALIGSQYGSFELVHFQVNNIQLQIEKDIMSFHVWPIGGTDLFLKCIQSYDNA